MDQFDRSVGGAAGHAPSAFGPAGGLAEKTAIEAGMREVLDDPVIRKGAH